MGKPSKKVIATAIALALSSNAYHAIAEEAQGETIEAVVVQGILPDRLESVPGSFNVVDEKTLRERQPFSMNEALNYIPGINIVGEDAFTLRPNIGIRGLDPRRTSRTLIMEDGMPLFLAPYGDPSANFLTPLQRVQRIEVVKGSGQILYGPQTIGGMINFVTKPVPTDGKLHGTAQAIVGNNDFSGLYANVGFGNERGGIMIDALQNKGDGIRRNHDFDIHEFTIKGQVNLTDNQTLIAKVGYLKEESHQSEVGLGVLDYARDKFQAPTGRNDLFEQERKTAQLQHIFQINDTTKLSTQAYYVDTFRTSFRQTDAPGRYSDDTAGSSTGITRLDRCSRDAANDPNGCGGRHRPRDYQYFGFEPRLDFQHELFGLKSDAVIGFRYHEEDISRRQFRDGNPLIKSLSWAKANIASREDIAIQVEAKSYYLQNTFYAGDFSITPGLRYEDIKIKTDIRRAGGNPQNNPESDSTNRQSELLPGLGVAWNGIANTTVFAGVHKGFAPPRPDRDITVPGADQARVDQTRPETSTNYELGLRSNFFKGVSFETTLFHTKVDDLVINNGLGSFINAAKTEQSGIEFGGRIDFGKIYDTPHNIYLQGSYTNLFTAEFKSNGLRAKDGIVDGDRLPYAPRHLASVSLGYEHPIGFDVRFGVDYVSRQQPDAFARALNVEDPSGVDTALSGLAGDIPAYTLLNMSANYRPIGSKVGYFLSGYNLADRQFLASRVDGMAVGRGRQVIGGVRFDF
jgi:Fe(3+) dicitrate transport protein